MTKSQFRQMPAAMASSHGHALLGRVHEWLRRRKENDTHHSCGLAHAFCRLRDEFAHGLRFRVFVTGQPTALMPAQQEALYLIGREALVNALRHSEATKIEAEVDYLPRRVRVVVRDNGRGIDPHLVRRDRDAHCGLREMRETAERIGGQLRIRSRPGAGTEVEISVV